MAPRKEFCINGHPRTPENVMPRTYNCRICQYETKRRWEKAHPERVAAYRRKRYEADPEGARARANEYNRTHRPQKLENERKSYQRKNELRRARRAANPEKTKEERNRFYRARPEYSRNFKRKAREELHDWYVCSQAGLPRDAAPELIDMVRLLKTLNRERRKQNGTEHN